VRWRLPRICNGYATHAFAFCPKAAHTAHCATGRMDAGFFPKNDRAAGRDDGNNFPSSGRSCRDETCSVQSPSADALGPLRVEIGSDVADRRSASVRADDPMNRNVRQSLRPRAIDAAFVVCPNRQNGSLRRADDAGGERVEIFAQRADQFASAMAMSRAAGGNGVRYLRILHLSLQCLRLARDGCSAPSDPTHQPCHRVDTRTAHSERHAIAMLLNDLPTARKGYARRASTGRLAKNGVTRRSMDNGGTGAT